MRTSASRSVESTLRTNSSASGSSRAAASRTAASRLGRPALERLREHLEAVRSSRTARPRACRPCATVTRYTRALVAAGADVAEHRLGLPRVGRRGEGERVQRLAADSRGCAACGARPGATPSPCRRRPRSRNDRAGSSPGSAVGVGGKKSASTGPAWPESLSPRTSNSTAPTRYQMRMRPSSPAETRRPSRGVKARARTVPSWPGHVAAGAGGQGEGAHHGVIAGAGGEGVAGVHGHGAQRLRRGLPLVHLLARAPAPSRAGAPSTPTV